MASSTKQVSDQKTSNVSSNTVDPTQLAQYQQNYTAAQNRANSLTPYQGQLTAGFNPNQIQAQGILANVATDPRYQAANNNAVGAVQGVLNNPLNGQINASPITASTYNAAQLAGTDLKPYLNPFTSNVIDTTNAQIERARQVAQVGDSQQATAAGAFGGSRSGVMAALTNGEYDRNTSATDAALNQANYSQAQQGALSDIGARNSASQFNAGQTQNAGIFNSDQNFNAQQNSFNNNFASRGQTLNAAGQLVSTNNNGLALAQQQGGILSAVGDTQQAQQQNELSNAYQNYMTGQQLTVQQQALINQALGMIPIQQTQTSNGTSNGTTTTTQNPGAMGIIGGLGSLALAAGTGGASAGLTGALGGLGAMSGGMSALGQMTGSNAAGYGGIFGAAAPSLVNNTAGLFGSGMPDFLKQRYAGSY